MIVYIVDGGHFNLVHTGRKGATPLCLRWFLNTLYPYVTPCKIAKTCHQVPDYHESDAFPSQLFCKTNEAIPQNEK